MGRIDADRRACVCVCLCVCVSVCMYWVIRHEFHGVLILFVKATAMDYGSWSIIESRYSYSRFHIDFMELCCGFWQANCSDRFWFFFGDFQEESKSSEHYTEDWAEEAEEAEESEHQPEGLVSRWSSPLHKQIIRYKLSCLATSCKAGRN